MLNVRLQVQNPDGHPGPVYEEVPVRAAGDGLVVALNSPMLVENLAAGDLIRVHEDSTFEVVRRGGNICVQFFRASPPTVGAETELIAVVERLGGRLDTAGAEFLVFTIPLNSSCFSAIEAAFGRAVDGSVESGWMFGNVYDPRDGTPLNWWLGVESP